MMQKFGRFLFLIVLLALFFGTSKATGIYVDWLFFREVGFEKVFAKVMSTQVMTGLGFGLFFFLFAAINVLIACNAKVPSADIILMSRIRIALDPDKFIRILKPLGLLASAFFGIMSGLWGSDLWSQVLTYLNRVNVGTTDPIFSHDIGFYLFQFPLYQSVSGYAGFLLFFTLLITVALYVIRGGVMLFGNTISAVKQAKGHVALLVFLFFVKLAFGFYLDRFETLYSSHTALTGAGYADVYGRLAALGILVPLTVIGGIAFSLGLWREKWKVALYPVAALVVIYVLGVGVYPALLQNFKVAPSEQALEEPFIKNHITLTRFGYNLEKVQVVPFDVNFNLTTNDIKKNDATIKNIRLWDETPLLKTYGQLQQIRTYYKFHGVDNDRYTIGGEYRQVMLSARELSYDDLPSKSWINEKLVFTHGNGVVMGYVNKVSREGLPEFIVKDIPPVSAVGVKITSPELYYGELTNDYVIVDTKMPEFSHPTAEGNVYSSYKGNGGVLLDSWAKRALYAAHFQTAKILFTGEIKENSRILYNRNITERVRKIAPFLYYDSDPYVVTLSDGKLYWIIDAYTVSTNMPYSKPLKNRINYMRNSVKVVIDAYEGKTAFYLSDPDDSISKVYKKIFPELFKTMKEMPADLKSHVRYPRDFFKVQTSLYATYHMNDAKVFYNKEDLWEIPVRNEKPMDPYYLIMKLPEEKREEYVLLVPYTPSKRDNLAAWFAARCDDPNYGRLIVFTFPRDRLVFGPRQVDARIDQDSFISQQLTLWGQRGSQVIRGSLQIIPIEKSLLYVQPLYLAAEDKGGLPEMRRVIAAYENNVVMEETLEQCLNALFGGRKGPPAAETAPATGAATVKKASVQDLAREAGQIFDRAKALQRQGDWAGYGEQLKKLEQVLKQLAP
jgi:uncharacterized protein